MPESFIKSFAKRLSEVAGQEVVVVQSGMKLNQNTIYLMPSGRNTVLEREGEKVLFKRSYKIYEAYNNPSIDAMLLSTVAIFGQRTIGVILTGMGSDGAKGLKEIKEKGGLTIAQSKVSCVVYGMPSRANQLDAVDHNLDIKNISPFVVSAIS